MLRATQTQKFFNLLLSMVIIIGFTTFAEADSPVMNGDMREVGASDSKDDQEEMLALLSILEEETEVATKSRMNNDYVPGMVTVLHGDHLEALGALTVAEALSLVPGIQLSRVETGEPSLKVRGIAFPFNAGNVKVMLNSISLSRESSGINSSVLLIPVQQIERIEVIRGPGSSIYGDFAMMGVVNIITRNTGGRVLGLPEMMAPSEVAATTRTMIRRIRSPWG